MSFYPTEVRFRGHRLVQQGDSVVLTTEQGRQSIKDAELSRVGDEVTLSTDSQTLSFELDGSRARLTDHKDPIEPTYHLMGDGRFRFQVAGFDCLSKPSAEGTLVLPNREVNPLLPLESVLPNAEPADQPTSRVSRARAVANLAADYPWVPGLAVGAVTLALGDFSVATVAASATTLACLGMRMIPEKKDTNQLLRGGALVGGDLTTRARRGRAPEPGKSRPTGLRVDSLQVRLKNGIELHQRGRTLQLVGAGKKHSFRAHFLTAEAQNISVKEPSGRVHLIQPDGSLNLLQEPEHRDEPSEFSAVYDVLKNQTPQNDVKELEFTEDEIHFDEFHLPYDH